MGLPHRQSVAETTKELGIQVITLSDRSDSPRSILLTSSSTVAFAWAMD